MTASYLHACLAENVPLKQPLPSVCLLTWREEPIETMNNS